jgi:formylglycine-generating enzyme required for sulfatase activity
MAWAKHLETPIEITNSIGMKLALLPPGEFDMGSSQEEVDRFLAEARQQSYEDWQLREAPTEVPKRRIRITTPCYFGKCEVTMGQFAQFVAATGYVTFAERVANGQVQAGPDGVWRRGDTWRRSGENWVGGQTQNHPVIIVTWNDADAFCQWLSSQEHKNYRMPTEAEWEYACRAGTATRFPWGEAVASVTSYAHMRIGAGDMGFLPVGRLRPNAFGLHDMLGNVAEL